MANTNFKQLYQEQETSDKLRISDRINKTDGTLFENPNQLGKSMEGKITDSFSHLVEEEKVPR